jgi:hypothetical protein
MLFASDDENMKYRNSLNTGLFKYILYFGTKISLCPLYD